MKKLLFLILFSSTAVNANDLECLTANIYNESRGKPVELMIAVGQVTLNRVNSKRYPNNICAVVKQRYQFSWTDSVFLANDRDCNETDREEFIDTAIYFNGFVAPLCGVQALYLSNALPTIHDFISWIEASQVASALMNGVIASNNDALYYHRKDVNPKWASAFQPIATINNHIFYEE